MKKKENGIRVFIIIWVRNKQFLFNELVKIQQKTVKLKSAWKKYEQF